MGFFRLAKPRFLAFFALEGAIIVGVLYGLASLTRTLAPTTGSYLSLTAALAATYCGLILLVIQGSSLGDHIDLRREFVLFSSICLLTGAVAFMALWLFFGNPKAPPSLLLAQAAVVVPVAVGLWRWISVRFDVFNATRESVLIVGTGEMAREVCRWIESSHSNDYAVLGFADENDSRIGTILAMGRRIQTDYENLARFTYNRADRVIVSLDEKRGKLPVRQLMELRLRGVEIEEATSFFERISGKIAVETMLPSWLIFSDGFKTSSLRSMLKRAADLFLSVLLLILAAPLMLFTALLVAITSGTPVIYRQSRMGLNGHEFNVLKFRSMRQDAEKHGPTWAQKSDPRVTRVGKIIRKIRVDELPQLVNVLRGEMSFVGPRPERRHFVRQLEEKIPYYGLRMTVRPGLTGWAQVEYGYGATDEDALEKLKYDLYYIKNNNLLMDHWIVLKTIMVVLRGSGAH